MGLLGKIKMKRTTALEINANLDRINAASNWILISILSGKNDTTKQDLIKYCQIIIEKTKNIERVMKKL